MTSTGDVIFSNVCFSEAGRDEVSFCGVLFVLPFCLLETCSGVSATAVVVVVTAAAVATGAVIFLGFSTEEGGLLITTLVSFGLRFSGGGLLLPAASFTLLRFSVFCIGTDTVELSLLFVLLFDLLCCN